MIRRSAIAVRLGAKVIGTVLTGAVALEQLVVLEAEVSWHSGAVWETIEWR